MLLHLCPLQATYPFSALAYAVDLSLGSSRDRRLESSLRQHTGKRTAPIDRRAWGLQEAMLSPRMLRFGKMVSFGCDRMESDESMYQHLNGQFELPSQFENRVLGFKDRLRLPLGTE